MPSGRLAGVGGRIVASVPIRLIQFDPESVGHVPDFAAHPTFATLVDSFASVEAGRNSLRQKENFT